MLTFLSGDWLALSVTHLGTGDATKTDEGGGVIFSSKIGGGTIWHRTIWHQDSKNGQLGTKLRKRTIWHQHSKNQKDVGVALFAKHF